MSKHKLHPLFDPGDDFQSSPEQEPPSSMGIDPEMQMLMQNPEEQSLRKPVEEESRSLEKLMQSSDEHDAFYQQQIEKKWNLMHQLTDRSMYQKVMAVRGELFEMSANHRLTMYDLLLQTRQLQTKELCDSKLHCLKSYYRRRVASFVMIQMEEMTREVRGHQFRFIELMKSKHHYAESVKSIPSLHANYMKALFAEEVRYMQFLEKLILKFEGSVNEELRLYGK